MNEVKMNEVKRDEDLTPIAALAGESSCTEEEMEVRNREIDHAADLARQLLDVGVPRPDVETKPFAQLLRSEEDLRRVFERVEQTIWRSFGEDIRRSPFNYTKPTLPEIKRRFKMCESWFRRARGDLGYSLEQTLDSMGRALRCELDGGIFDPPKAGSRIYTST